MEVENNDEVELLDDQTVSFRPSLVETPTLFSLAPFNKMLRLSTPLMLAHLTNMLGGFGNVYLFSRLGPKPLAAAGLITTTQNLFMASFGGSLFSASVLMTEELAQPVPDSNKLGKLWRQTQLLTVIYDGMTVPFFLTMDRILSHLGQDATLLPHLQNYFNYYGIGFSAALLNLGNQQILLSHGNTPPILMLNTANNLACFGLGYLLVDKLNAWQESDMAFAYAVSTWSSFLCSTLYIRYKYSSDNLFSCSLKPLLSSLRSLVRKGLPMGLQNGAEVIALWVSMLMAGKFGDANLTAAEIAGQYVYILTVPGFALGQATMILSAEQYSKKNYVELRYAGFRAMLLSQVLPALGMLLFVSIPKPLTQFFLDNNTDAPEILETTQRLLIINGVGQLFDSLRQCTTGALLGQNDTIYPATVNIFSMCFVGIVSSYLMGFVGEEGVEGIFMGRSISMALATLLLAVRWFCSTRNFINAPQALLDADGESMAEGNRAANELRSPVLATSVSDSSLVTRGFFRESNLQRSNSYPVSLNANYSFS